MYQLIAAIDALLCVVVLVAAIDYLRAVYFFDRPIQSMAFLLIAVGAFGLVLWLMAGNTPSIWAFMMHIGLAVFAIEEHSMAMDLESGQCWPNIDRRGRE